MLVVAGARVDQPTHYDDSLPLWAAAHNNNTEIVALLIDADADVNGHRRGESDPPLHAAATHGHVEIARLLLDRGADIERSNDRGVTALWAASNNKKSLAVVRLLLKRGAKHTSDREGRTPLMGACMALNVDGARELLLAGADPDPADSPLSYSTPLEWTRQYAAMGIASAHPFASLFYGFNVSRYSICVRLHVVGTKRDHPGSARQGLAGEPGLVLRVVSFLAGEEVKKRGEGVNTT